MAARLRCGSGPAALHFRFSTDRPAARPIAETVQLRQQPTRSTVVKMQCVRRRHENWSTPWSEPDRTTRAGQGRHLWSRCLEPMAVETAVQTPQDVEAMRRLSAAGWGRRRIAKELGCSPKTLRLINKSQDLLPPPPSPSGNGNGRGPAAGTPTPPGDGAQRPIDLSANGIQPPHPAEPTGPQQPQLNQPNPESKPQPQDQAKGADDHG